MLSIKDSKSDSKIIKNNETEVKSLEPNKNNNLLTPPLSPLPSPISAISNINEGKTIKKKKIVYNYKNKFNVTQKSKY